MLKLVWNVTSEEVDVIKTALENQQKEYLEVLQIETAEPNQTYHTRQRILCDKLLNDIDQA